ncbi:MAG: hypothetical protein IMZ61_14835 [Planctomycetes bacterium]|nr:hypothetical protein [Thermoplasmata archaeon]MBE3145173.1 hypothetical protein [Planctomycetota bacterium]
MKRRNMWASALVIAIALLVPAALLPCSASVNCPGGEVIWCQTFGNCGENGATCMEGQSAVLCECNGVIYGLGCGLPPQ